jgi:hypothetical protein
MLTPDGGVHDSREFSMPLLAFEQKQFRLEDEGLKPRNGQSTDK